MHFQNMMWLATYTLVRNKQYDEACEADEDLEMLREVRHRMAIPYNRELRLLFENQGAGEPSEGTMGALGENEEPEGILEKAALGLSWVLVPSTNMRIIRGAIEGDMRRRNISQHDINVTVSFLAGAMEQDKYRAIAFAAVFALPAIYVLDHLEKLGRWGPVMPALLLPVSAMSFQDRWLSMYIRDKPAVAAFLKERLRIS
ncbi:hypothetical protein FOMPIDRAFT_1052388 [Fomitopsis schrenkii]|uniref:Uncharacterized protein n=1 Tax=Fomitopsis schrenkii TaxID=2126942 RepID=S8DWA0_FOMSC|nr:hypothetical protein FOMPIDRAFT_1052388 [Fomitopsis schrenkii]